MMQTKFYNNTLFITVLTIICLGALLMYSASSAVASYRYDQYDSYFLIKHITWLIIGFLSCFIFSLIDCDFLKRNAKLILFFSWVLVLIPIVMNIDQNSIDRWLKIGNFTLMSTSDFARIAIIIFLAAFIEEYHQEINNIKILFQKLLPYILITIGLIVYQPDLSTSFVTCSIIFILLYIAGINKKIIFGLLFSAVSFFLIIISFFSYQSERIIAWLLGANDQANNSILSLANGGFWGVGLGNSTFKYGHVPESQTDFILSVIGEEIGFLGILVIFVLFGFLFYKGFEISKLSRNRFSMFLSIGITINIFLYLIINASYVTGILPTTGLPIPFISYGGSQTIFSLLSIGILISISKTNLRVNKTRYYYES